MTTPSQYTWLAKLMAYNYEIQYKQWKTNKAADALSRVNSLELLVHFVNNISPNLYLQVQQSWQQDPSLKDVITKIQQGGHV